MCQKDVKQFKKIRYTCISGDFNRRLKEKAAISIVKKMKLRTAFCPTEATARIHNIKF